MRFCQLLILLSLGLATYGSAHAGSLTGRVLDAETGNPISDVNIRLIETDQTDASDNKGIFQFTTVTDGTYHLIATHVAYDPSDTLTVTVNGATVFDLTLAPMPWVLNDVVVTGTRSPHLLKDVPVQTELITQRDFQRTGAKSVDEALSSTIGTTISNNDFTGSGASIRGIDKDRVMVLVDGERAVGRVNGTIDLSQYSLTNVQKIEIVKGTGSTLYGSEAMGGVINIITSPPQQDTKAGKFYADYGTHKTASPSAEFMWGGTKAALTAGAKYYATDGFDLLPETPHTNGADKIGRWNFDAKLTNYLSSEWRLTTTGRFMHEKRNWVESEEWPGFTLVYDDEETNKRYEGSVGMQFLSGEKYSMHFKLYGTFYDHIWSKTDQETGTWVDTSETQDSYWEASYSSNYVIGDNHVATYGANYVYQDLTSSELSGEKKASRSGAAYLQYEYAPVKRLTFLPGVRYENHSAFGGKFNPSMNIMYQPNENIKFRAFGGYGFRAPSIKEQYFIFDHSAAGYIVYGGQVDLPDNISFDPDHPYREMNEENSLNSSLSVEFSYGTIGLHRLTYFYNHLHDLVEFTMVGSSPTYWRGIYVYQNIDRAFTQGIEWESRIRLASWLDLSFSYNFLEAHNLENGEDLINRPPHTVKAVLSVTDSKSGFGGSFWGNYQSHKLWTSRSNTGEQEEDPTWAPHRTTLNLNLFKRFSGDKEAFLRLENLLDETDVVYGYWPGRQIFAGFRFGLQLTDKQ
ncbi:MAG: TonB-dependent receptor [bacterium]|nr:TonB-dependent receptor [bacterium]